MSFGTIGTFTLGKDGGWTGCIRTLSLDAKVRLVPNDNRESENAPIFRVIVGQSHIGDAWKARSSGGSPKDYFRVRLDDPLFLEPIRAALFISAEGDQAELVWTRRPPAS